MAAQVYFIRGSNSTGPNLGVEISADNGTAHAKAKEVVQNLSTILAVNLELSSDFGATFVAYTPASQGGSVTATAGVTTVVAGTH